MTSFFSDVERSIAETGDALLGASQFPVDLLREVHRKVLDAAYIVDASRGLADRASVYVGELGGNLKTLARLVQSIYMGMLSSVQVDVNQAARATSRAYKRNDSTGAKTLDGVPLSRRQEGDNGSNTSIGSRSIPKGKKAVSVPRGVSLRTFAVQQMGSAGMWKDIAMLNGLSAPYISESGDGVSVLRPGDTILIPVVPESSGDENQIYPSSDATKTDAKRYGRDLLISLDTKDFKVDNRGDLDVVEGLDNLRQAGHIKLFTRPGDLVLHPNFGFEPSAGDGLAIDTLARQHLQLRETLLSDSRIASIASMSMKAKGDVLQVKILAVPKDMDDSLALSAGIIRR